MRKTYVKIASVFLAVFAIASFIFIYKKNYVEAQSTGSSVGSSNVTTSADPGRWKEDPEVTAVGKAGARAREVLNWSLSIKDAGFSPGGNDTLKDTWSRIRDMMGIFYFIIIIIIGFGLIAKQDWAEKARRSLPALIIAFIAAYFSFFVAAGIIKFTDEQIQQRFYTIHNWDKSGSLEQKHLRAQDLLTVSFNYQEFKGYRKVGAAYGEAVANHLLLVKITTFTNYVIAFIILLRIIILWGLVIFSPFMFPFFVFPLTKKVATVWLREFFRWLLLGPLFALFLTSIPYMWSKTNISVKDVYPGQKAQNSGVPLEVQKEILSPSGAGEKTTGNVYESGTNIILAPPGNKNPDIQKDSNIASGNNLSETDTYARWIVALLMIWGAIILPFMLLRIVMGFSVEVGKSISNVFNNSQAAQYINSIRKAVAPPPQPVGPGPGGITREKLIERVPTIAPTRQLIDRKEKISTFNEKSVEKLSVPTILNVAGLKQEVPEIFSLATAAENDQQRKISELAKIEQQSQRSTLVENAINNISEPEKISDSEQQQRFSKVKESVLMRSVAGDRSANAMKNAMSQNISQYLVADAKTEVASDLSKKIGESITDITNESIVSEEVQQLQNSYKVSQVKNFTEVLNKLAQSSDPRALPALAALSKIKQVQNTQIADRPAFLQKISANISNPQAITDPTERQEYMALREVVKQGSDSGISSLSKLLHNSEALSALGQQTAKELISLKIKDLSNALSNFSTAMSQDQKNQTKISDLKSFENVLNNALAEGSENGLKVAAKAAISMANPDQVQNQEEKSRLSNVAGLIRESAQEGMPTAQTVEAMLGEISQDLEIDQDGNIQYSSIPSLRKSVQDDEDFIKTKNLWADHYMNAPTPEGKERKIWLTEEISSINLNLNNLLSTDATKKEEALKSIKKLLPLALMGNYKTSEIAKYLLAKLDAAQETLNKISTKNQKSELEFVTVTGQVNQNNNKKTMSLEGENEKNI